jgi:hypothetical protein
VTADPPFDAGGLKLTMALAFPASALTPVGSEGVLAAAAGVTLLLAAEAAPGPTPLVAVTVKT